MEDYRFSYLAYLGDQHNSYVVVFLVESMANYFD